MPNYKWLLQAPKNINNPTKINKHPDSILSFFIAEVELKIARDFSIIAANTRLPINGITAETNATAAESISVNSVRLKNPGSIPRQNKAALGFPIITSSPAVNPANSLFL